MAVGVSETQTGLQGHSATHPASIPYVLSQMAHNFHMTTSHPREGKGPVPECTPKRWQAFVAPSRSIWVSK